MPFVQYQMVGGKSKLLTIKHDLMAIRLKPSKVRATDRCTLPHLRSHIKWGPYSHCKSNYAYDSWAAARKLQRYMQALQKIVSY